MAQKVSEFFDRQVGDYYDEVASHPMAPFHVQTAARLQESLDGSVLCVGGLWCLADLKDLRCRITVADVSKGMLKEHQEQDVALVINGGLDLAFGSGSFDHVVLPLVLHHITGSTASSARANVLGVMREVARVLKPGGRVWISELCPSRPVYLVERAAAPLTRAFLEAADVPFVMMHSAHFYKQVLEQLDFRNVRVDRVRSAEAKATDWLQPVDGIPWLRVPRFMFPVKATVISGER